MKNLKKGHIPTQLKAKNLEEMARIDAEQRNNREASYKYKEAAEIWKKLGNPEQSKRCTALALENEAWSFRKYKKYTGYRAKLTEAAKLWEELDSKRELIWCKANIHDSLALDAYYSGHHEESIENFEIARKLFNELGAAKAEKFCEAWALACMARTEYDKRNFSKTSELMFEAVTKFKEADTTARTIAFESTAWLAKGLAVKKSAEYTKAKECFQISAKLSEVAGNEQQMHWCMGNLKECDVVLAKLSGDIKDVLECLRAAVSEYEKTQDKVTISSYKGDICKYEGLLLMREDNYSEALKKFSESEKYYSEAAELLSSPTTRPELI